MRFTRYLLKLQKPWPRLTWGIKGKLQLWPEAHKELGKELSESSVREKSQISAALFNFRGCLSFKIWGDIFYGRAVMHLSFFGHPVAGRGGGRSCVNITLHGEFNRGGFERLPQRWGKWGRFGLPHPCRIRPILQGSHSLENSLNFRESPWKGLEFYFSLKRPYIFVQVLEFSSTVNVVAWKVLFNTFWLSKTDDKSCN